MIGITRFTNLLIVAIAILIPFSPSLHVGGGRVHAATQYEIPAILDAAELLDGIPLKGTLYQIDREVPTDGFLMKFTVQSDFGTFYPKSPEMVATLLIEIAAIQQLEDISKSEVFIDGLKKSGKEIGREVKTLVTEPVKTIKGAGTGIGRFFQRTYRTTKTSVQKLGDKISEEDQANQAAPGSDSKLPGAAPKEGKGSSDTDLAEAGMKMAGNTVINILGYNDQRRQLAKQLQVDPYTTNTVLADKLDEVAWAAFAGGLGVKAVKMVVPASMVLSVSTTLTGWVWDVPPGDLRVFNESALLTIGVTQESVDNFLKNRWYTLTLQGRLVRALIQLKQAEDRAEVIALALTVSSEDQARFVTEAVELLAHYHKHVFPITKINVNSTVIGQLKKGAFVFPTPLDYVSWIKRLDKFTDRSEFGDAERIIYLRGQLSKTAKKELGLKKWQLLENVLDK